MSKNEWRLADDPLESAQMYIQQNGLEHQVAMLDIAAELGTKVLAFQVTDFVRLWAKNTQELAMDSTCE